MKIKTVLIIAIAILISSNSVIYTGSDSFVNENVEIKKLTKAEFEKLVYDPVNDGEKAAYKGKKPCIVDFYADWCGPCRRLSPVLEELAAKYDGKLIIYKVNVDAEKELAKQYEIRAIPTLMLCPLKSMPSMLQGAPSKEELETYISDVLKVK
ncbi:thioredoxin [Bacteroidales bacterium OttesenSCG-928-B11]|nr:thioredoxin [Bacteroidales bacterium OttesenSCG-928-B11]